MAGPTQISAQVPLSTATASANTYTDPNGLAALKAHPDSPQAQHQVAQQVDALFLQMMLQSMRDASAEISGKQSNELGMYQDMFDKQIALTMSQHQTLGLGASIVGRTPANHASSASPGGMHVPAPAPPLPPPRATTPAVPIAATAVPGQAAASIAQTAEDFIRQVLPTITQAAQQLGVSARGLLAQAALETGWGQRMARTADGAPSLNLFGIKADTGWDGERATATTLEFSGGVASPQRAAFRAYGSIADSVNDFAKLLRNSPRYSHAIAAGTNAQAYVAAIGRSGYATDPQYGNKLNEILNGSTLQAALRHSGQML